MAWPGLVDGLVAWSMAWWQGLRARGGGGKGGEGDVTHPAFYLVISVGLFGLSDSLLFVVVF